MGLDRAALAARPGGGRPREADLREVVNAILYILRTGCQWRYLPNDLPPKSTVWRYFDLLADETGPWTPIHDLLRRKVRTTEKPYRPRTTASVDSQSVDTTSGGEQRGRDNPKNVDGRKRHIVVDSMGLLLAVLVTAADVDDATAATALFARLEGQPISQVAKDVRRQRSITTTPSMTGWPSMPAGSCRSWPASRRQGGLGQVADTLDGGADLRLAGQVPTTEQGPGEECAVLGGVHQVGDDPPHVSTASSPTMTDAKFPYRPAA